MGKNNLYTMNRIRTSIIKIRFAGSIKKSNATYFFFWVYVKAYQAMAQPHVDPLNGKVFLKCFCPCFDK